MVYKLAVKMIVCSVVRLIAPSWTRHVARWIGSVRKKYVSIFTHRKM